MWREYRGKVLHAEKRRTCEKPGYRKKLNTLKCTERKPTVAGVG